MVAIIKTSKGYEWCMKTKIIMKCKVLRSSVTYLGAELIDLLNGSLDVSTIDGSPDDDSLRHLSIIFFQLYVGFFSKSSGGSRISLFDKKVHDKVVEIPVDSL